MMDDEGLQKLVEEISLKFFGRKFRHQAFFNSRLRTTGGRYNLETHNIDINPKMLTEHGMDTLTGVIKHELCHYHLHLEGRGHGHRDPEFRALLEKTGGSRYAPVPKKKSARPQNIYIYRCSGCGALYQRRRRINTARFVCSGCHGRIELIESHKFFVFFLKSLASFPND